jgi:hypothetical protein
MGKKSGSGSGMHNPNHILESLGKPFFGLKYLKSLMRIRDGKIWILDPCDQAIKVKNGEEGKFIFKNM